VAKHTPTAPGPPAHWEFLTNHAQVLLCLAADPRLTMREMAHRVGVTERRVQQIVADLAAAGYVTITRVGRRNEYVVHRGEPLRGPVADGLTVVHLVDLGVGGAEAEIAPGVRHEQEKRGPAVGPEGAARVRGAQARSGGSPGTPAGRCPRAGPGRRPGTRPPRAAGSSGTR
jgi:Winged helix-turn-helix DNA-binding